MRVTWIQADVLVQIFSDNVVRIGGGVTLGGSWLHLDAIVQIRRVGHPIASRSSRARRAGAGHPPVIAVSTGRYCAGVGVAGGSVIASRAFGVSRRNRTAIGHLFAHRFFTNAVRVTG